MIPSRSSSSPVSSQPVWGIVSHLLESLVEFFTPELFNRYERRLIVLRAIATGKEPEKDTVSDRAFGGIERFFDGLVRRITPELFNRYETVIARIETEIARRKTEGIETIVGKKYEESVPLVTVPVSTPRDEGTSLDLDPEKTIKNRLVQEEVIRQSDQTTTVAEKPLPPIKTLSETVDETHTKESVASEEEIIEEILVEIPEVVLYSEGESAFLPPVSDETPMPLSPDTDLLEEFVKVLPTAPVTSPKTSLALSEESSHIVLPVRMLTRGIAALDHIMLVFEREEALVETFRMSRIHADNLVRALSKMRKSLEALSVQYTEVSTSMSSIIHLYTGTITQTGTIEQTIIHLADDITRLTAEFAPFARHIPEIDSLLSKIHIFTRETQSVSLHTSSEIHRLPRANDPILQAIIRETQGINTHAEQLESDMKYLLQTLQDTVRSTYQSLKSLQEKNGTIGNGRDEIAHMIRTLQASTEDIERLFVPVAEIGTLVGRIVLEECTVKNLSDGAKNTVTSGMLVAEANILLTVRSGFELSAFLLDLYEETIDIDTLPPVSLFTAMRVFHMHWLLRMYLGAFDNESIDVSELDGQYTSRLLRAFERYLAEHTDTPESAILSSSHRELYHRKRSIILREESDPETAFRLLQNHTRETLRLYLQTASCQMTEKGITGNRVFET